LADVQLDGGFSRCTGAVAHRTLCVRRSSAVSTELARSVLAVLLPSPGDGSIDVQQQNIGSREEHAMGDMKDKVKGGIDKAAGKTKEVAGKAIDKTKSAARSTGDSLTKAGQKLKDAGRR
jgi:uncharacterized protein YjbJ (UPF0337 family)